jgi:hypothetical protein
LLLNVLSYGAATGSVDDGHADGGLTASLASHPPPITTAVWQSRRLDEPPPTESVPRRTTIVLVGFPGDAAGQVVTAPPPSPTRSAPPTLTARADPWLVPLT